MITVHFFAMEPFFIDSAGLISTISPSLYSVHSAILFYPFSTHSSKDAQSMMHPALQMQNTFYLNLLEMLRCDKAFSGQ